MSTCRRNMLAPCMCSKWFFAGYDVNQEVELVGFVEGFGNIRPRKSAALVGICDDEGTRGYLFDEDCSA